MNKEREQEVIDMKRIKKKKTLNYSRSILETERENKQKSHFIRSKPQGPFNHVCVECCTQMAVERHARDITMELHCT
jgi:hypothetical protein